MAPITPLTPDYLAEQIVSVDYLNPKPTLTLCIFTMVNGLYVIGKSAVLDPARFDAVVGRTVAYQDAFNQLCQLEGYARAVLAFRADQLWFCHHNDCDSAEELVAALRERAELFAVGGTD